MDYTLGLPVCTVKSVGEHELYVQVFEGVAQQKEESKRPSLLLIHGAYGGSWMWSKYIPRLVAAGYTCYAMNMRSHYKSRVLDLTAIGFDDYVADVKEVLKICGDSPVLLGHSMGGLLAQKIAETEAVRGIVLIDSSAGREVNAMLPVHQIDSTPDEKVIGAPDALSRVCEDESREDALFQHKYLQMESAKAMRDFSFAYGAKEGVSINAKGITCPSLTIKAVQMDEDDKRGRNMAEYLGGDYFAMPHSTHTGIMVGQRTDLVADHILAWLKQV